MLQNRVKKVMGEGNLALGSYVDLADPHVIEIIGLAGFDAAFIDLVHTTFDLRLIAEMVRAADVVGITSMVQVPQNDLELIVRVLDTGAHGIIVPHINGVEDARRAVAAVRFPPLGERAAASGTRAARFGAVPWEDHVRWSDEEVILSVMVEDKKAINQVEEIAALDGVDLIAIGPTDLAQDLGVRDADDPRLRSAVEDVARRVKGVGKARLAVPMNNPLLPLSPTDLLDLGVGYTHLGPTPPAILLRALRDGVRSVHMATGRAS